MKAEGVSGATPFLGYTVEPAGCSLYCGPGALALLKIDPLERWRSDPCCVGVNIRSSSFLGQEKF